MNSHHLVVLGAEAASEALPGGERDGRKVPGAHDIAAAAGLTEDLEQLGIPHDKRSFEEIYRDLYGNTSHAPAAARIEQKLYEHYSSLHLPEQPTLYDHLVLSLRPKDIIASFCWDPFLHDACLRNNSFAPLPRVLYLVGTIRLGTCRRHRISGRVGTACVQCGSIIQPPNAPLADPGINRAFKKNLENVVHLLADALLLTVIGPAHDTVTRDLLRMAEERMLSGSMEEIELISRRKAGSYRLQVVDSFYDSRIAKHPRRTCEAAWNQFVEAKYVKGTDIPRAADLAALHGWYRPLVEAEQQAAAATTAPIGAKRYRQALRDEIRGNWSTARPTAPGLYLTANLGGTPDIVEIGGDPAARKGLFVKVPGDEKKYPLDEWRKPLWKGPISPPH